MTYKDPRAEPPFQQDPESTMLGRAILVAFAALLALAFWSVM